MIEKLPEDVRDVFIVAKLNEIIDVVNRLEQNFKLHIIDYIEKDDHPRTNQQEHTQGFCEKHALFIDNLFCPKCFKEANNTNHGQDHIVEVNKKVCEHKWVDTTYPNSPKRGRIICEICGEEKK